MTREEQMWKAVEEEHGELSRRESMVALTAMEWAAENKPVDWQQVRIQAAISAMKGIMSDVDSFTTNQSPNGVAKISVDFADSLVKELKGEK